MKSEPENAVQNQAEYTSIQILAYQIWEERGRPDGFAEACWREAEQLRREQKARAAKTADDASKASFPASDPPASHIPDVVPVNADDKWAAAAESPTPPTLRVVKEKKHRDT